MKLWPSGLLAAAVLVVAVGCDPAFDYEPIGLTKVGDRQWEIRLDGVELRLGRLGDLIGSRGLVPEFELINHGADVVAIEGARLITERASYAGDLPDEGDLRWRSAAPNTSTTIAVLWEFEDTAVNVLGDRPRIVLDLHIGQEKHQIEIQYQRI